MIPLSPLHLGLVASLSCWVVLIRCSQAAHSSSALAALPLSPTASWPPSPILSGSAHSCSSCNESVLRRLMMKTRYDMVTLIEAPQFKPRTQVSTHILATPTHLARTQKCFWLTTHERQNEVDTRTTTGTKTIHTFVHTEEFTVHNASVWLAHARPN